MAGDGRRYGSGHECTARVGNLDRPFIRSPRCFDIGAPIAAYTVVTKGSKADASAAAISANPSRPEERISEL